VEINIPIPSITNVPGWMVGFAGAILVVYGLMVAVCMFSSWFYWEGIYQRAPMGSPEERRAHKKCRFWLSAVAFSGPMLLVPGLALIIGTVEGKWPTVSWGGERADSGTLTTIDEEAREILDASYGPMPRCEEMGDDDAR